MNGSFDVAVIGGGVLGSSISYWLSTRYDADVCVIEAEEGTAYHASRRNTGVVHSPFYLDPKLHHDMANAMIDSRLMWGRLAAKSDIPWSQVGVLEVATRQSELDTLERHMTWGADNGIAKGELELVDANVISKIEPNVKCIGAIRCPGEIATDFGLLTGAIAEHSKIAGTQFVFGYNVASIHHDGQKYSLTSSSGSQIDASLVINCGGSRSLELAKMMGQAKDHTALHFRGEYWRAADEYCSLVGTSVYSVPRYSEYPFLDPHWIVRADGHVEVGPNAVPVSAPTAYEGGGGVSQSVTKLCEILGGKARRLLVDPSFLRMASTEWRSSVSKSAMISRIGTFVPSVRPEMFTKKGESGIRTPIVTPQGEFATKTIELYGDNSCSIINYNSPGATGAPAYSAHLVSRLHDKGYLDLTPKNYSGGIWSESDVERQS